MASRLGHAHGHGGCSPPPALPPGRGSSEQDFQEPDLTLGCVHQHEMYAQVYLVERERRSQLDRTDVAMRGQRGRRWQSQRTPKRPAILDFDLDLRVA